MTPNRRALLLLLVIAVALASCGGGSGSGAPVAGTGTVRVALTDTPSYAFDNVWITVRAAWFNQSETAPFDASSSGWIRFPLAAPVTLNLAALSGDNNLVTVFDGVSLPAGTYRQILLFLEPTESAPAASAAAKGLRFNNQVDAGTLHAALRVPNAAQGIRVARTIAVAKGSLTRLAIDFDIGRDVVPFVRGTAREFLLQPRPNSFDLDNAGAIVGFVDNVAARDNTAQFEVLAEQFDAAAGARVVRRSAAVDNATGRFVLYPLPPGPTGAQRYDVVIRGIGRRTAIVGLVPVTAGTTPASGATVLGTAAAPIPMPSATDYRIAAAMTATTGALAKFYQDVSGTGYIVRHANFDPLSGTIADFPLAAGQVGLGTFAPGGGAITLSPTSPDGGDGTYRLVAEAALCTPSAAPTGGVAVTQALALNVFTVPGLDPAAPAVPAGVGVTATMPTGQGVGPMDNVIVFATFGGTILNVQPLGAMSDGASAANTVQNLPGGSAGTRFAQAAYGISAYGWTTGADNVLRIGTPDTLARPQDGPVAVTITLQKVTVQ